MEEEEEEEEEGAGLLVTVDMSGGAAVSLCVYVLFVYCVGGEMNVLLYMMNVCLSVALMETCRTC
jgi:hypothetical protein